jgi:hypothetical protein
MTLKEKRKKLLESLINTTTTLIDIKSHILQEKSNKEDNKEVFSIVFEQTASSIEKYLFPVIKNQVQSIVDGLDSLTDGFTEKDFKSYEDQSHNLILQVFDSTKWKSPLLNAIIPSLAVGMVRSILSQYALIGVDILGLRKESKATTATEWLQNHSEDITLMDDVVVGAGVAGMTLLTEIPKVMKERIAKHLKDSFNQPYWEAISLTTGAEAEKIIQEGLHSGWSIKRMAGRIAEIMGTEVYAKERARTIAITESGGALNGARKDEMNSLMQDLPQLDMRPIWLSVLSATTRRSHAMLDMVPANENGMWYLGGIWVPYPGYSALPPGERVNCLCTIFMQFGIQQDHAARLIGNYFKRIR